MGRRFAGLAAITVLLLSHHGAAAGDGGGPLASPMIDTKVFRDDQVRRFSGQYGHWTTVCDDIKALNRRFCSLRSATAPDQRGRGVFMDVSTGDDGRPAALVHLPVAVSLQPGVRITLAEPGSAAKAGTKKSPAAAPVEVPVALCTATECLAVWNLDPARIRALNAGAELRVSFCTLGPGFSGFRASLGGRACETSLTAAIPGIGFKDAVLASVK